MGRRERLLRALPALVLLGLSLVWLGSTLPGAVVSGHYHPQAPGLHRLWSHALIGALSILVFAALALRHQSGNWPGWPRAGVELAAPVVLLAAALPVLTAWMRPPDEIRIVFRGQEYAIPRVWDPRFWVNEEGGESLSLGYCASSLAPVYDNGGGCPDQVRAVFSTAPLLADELVAIDLMQSGLRHANGRVIDPGAFILRDDGLYFFDTGWRDLTLRADPATGQVVEWRLCPRLDHLPQARCDMGVQIGELSARTELSSDGNPDVTLSELLQNLPTWLCPAASGCVKKG